MARRRKFFLFGRAPPHIWPLKVKLVVLVSAFVTVSIVWTVFCLLFYSSRCHMKSAPLSLWHCDIDNGKLRKPCNDVVSNAFFWIGLYL